MTWQSEDGWYCFRDQDDPICNSTDLTGVPALRGPEVVMATRPANWTVGWASSVIGPSPNEIWNHLLPAEGVAVVMVFLVLEQIALSLIAVLSEAVAPYIHFIVGVLGVPMDLANSTDAYTSQCCRLSRNHRRVRRVRHGQGLRDDYRQRDRHLWEPFIASTVAGHRSNGREHG
ncbi:hypothetical protein [Corynebacterium glaucum]|uniref:hypothetical protein n=1 Tax=Corynebacterium glaucum TaxID=187491 RepID=UPI0025B48D54|nr:hypothetical protein [Corynebacterium glaucum]